MGLAVADRLQGKGLGKHMRVSADLKTSTKCVSVRIMSHHHTHYVTSSYIPHESQC